MKKILRYNSQGLAGAISDNLGDILVKKIFLACHVLTGDDALVKQCHDTPPFPFSTHTPLSQQIFTTDSGMSFLPA